ncbi:MAG: glycosyltransferase [Campylobacteraceae bacterium]|nr:glycosyltransferase [Campylobacteraceae bacterium]
MKPLISVIVPVYKVEKYLKKCIDSIINQTYENLEIILVNDGSPDNCPQICDEYALKDRRVKVIHKENGGLSDARNAGLDVMSGEFVTFIDSDDFVSRFYIENLYFLVKKYEADITITEFLYIKDSQILALNESKISDEKVLVHQKDEFMQNIFYAKIYDIGATRKLFKSSFFEDIRFPKGRISEDLGTIPYVFEKASKIAFCKKQDYFYLIRDDSITRTVKFDEKYLSVYENIDELNSHFKDKETLKAIKFYDNLISLAAAVRFGKAYEKYAKKLKFSDFLEAIFNKNVKFTHKVYFLVYFCLGAKISARIWKLYTKS